MTEKFLTSSTYIFLAKVTGILVQMNIDFNVYVYIYRKNFIAKMSLSSTIEFHVVLENLPDLDLASKTDAFVVAFLQ